MQCRSQIALINRGNFFSRSLDSGERIGDTALLHLHRGGASGTQKYSASGTGPSGTHHSREPLWYLSIGRRPAAEGSSTRPRSRWSVPERQLRPRSRWRVPERQLMSVGGVSVVTVVVQQALPAITASDDVVVGTSELDTCRPRHNVCRSVNVRKPKIVFH